MTATAAAGLVDDDALAKRNARILALAQALGGANNVIVLATASIVGATLASDPRFATLPVTIYVIGLWQGTLPMGILARRYGRRAAFQIGTVCGVITGVLCCLAVLWGSFLLFNIGAFFTGLYAAATQSYRFAAADTASDAFKPKAISWVLAGGVGGAILGPQTIIFTKDLWAPYTFAPSYLGQSLIALVAAGVLSFLFFPRPLAHVVARAGRPLREIVRQPRFVVAVACGVASYTLMNLVMTSAPLAMMMSHHSATDSALGIQWHVLGMYAPSFFTGALIARFGVERVMAVGFALLALSAGVSMAGTTLAHFWIGLAILGVGWNFSFVGATTMVTQCHRAEERTTVQSFNDFLVFGSMAVGSFLSGTLLANYGWATVNLIVFPPVLAVFALLGWLAWSGRLRAASRKRAHAPD